ncbi:PQQ-binding-like beta-propeller repeat protein [Natrinema sp. 1APR25-10V2]|uniref:outer membrane protein assembly factor BamB family protein n=1 Tax=Natrinema sp. 1APR25-10V2 TaxID=2951081 RepID=UPI0028744C6E|nr:PQQ-binding-like beta-propeller repeat protein [Natrinema sp. 1APR25-10V2]MDS0474390.1 PQQ-binding-like beta-propeller repeat protein [Natrinema sp. 1APR25-10V2]
MNRRQTLRLLGAGTVSALAGCTSGTGNHGDDSAEAGESKKRVTGEWPMADFDPAHSGYAPDERGPGSSPAPLWQTGTGNDRRLTESGLGGAPAVRDGTLYLGASSGDVIAADATTGEEVWRNGTNFYIESSVAIGDEQLFVGAGDNHVHAFDLESGDRNWKRNFGTSVDSSVIYTDGLVICNPVYGALTAVDPGSGEPVWEYDGGIGYTPSVRAGSVYVPTANSDCGMWSGCTTTGGVDVVDVETGEKTDHCVLGEDVRPTSTPTLDDRQLYLTAEGGAVYAVSLESREVVWESSMGGSVGAVPTVSDTLITADTAGTVYAFDTADGTERFRLEAGSSVTGTCVASETLYVGAARGSDGVVHALDPASGEKQWSHELQTPVTTSPVVVDGVLYIGDKSGSLRALVAESELESYESAGNVTASE